jgi:hypothetical protein
MGRLALAAVLLLLSMPSSLVPAQTQVDSPPGWKEGDRWEYRVIVQGPSETTFGNLSQEIASVGPVRLDGRALDAYSVTSRLSRSANNVNSSTVSTIYVSRSDICVIFANSSSVTRMGDLSTRANVELRYNTSDGRYHFPLATGAGWEVDYNLTRTLSTGNSVSVEDRWVHVSCACEGPEKVIVPAGRFMAQKIVCAQDAVNRTSYWYSEAVRGEVKREELDGSTGVITTYELTRYHRAQEPAFLLGTDTGLAMVLAGISMVLLAAAAIIFWRGRKRDVLPPEKGGPGKSI